ncbi:regulator [Escherichia fergusonii]|nr:regulator [Escherichia fergusonii]EHG6207781.1 regulator [Escherichia fergusonii]
MDKELPWLADNAQLELKYKKGKTPLSHRNWPGEPVPVITESLIQTLGDKLLHIAEKKKTSSGVMKIFHWSGSRPLCKPST